jgi:hypothetical protein
VQTLSLLGEWSSMSAFPIVANGERRNDGQKMAPPIAPPMARL